MNEDGSMSRVPDLEVFKKKHNLKWCSIEELIKYRRKNEMLVKCEQTAKLPTRHGEFDISVLQRIC